MLPTNNMCTIIFSSLAHARLQIVWLILDENHCGFFCDFVRSQDMAASFSFLETISWIDITHVFVISVCNHSQLAISPDYFDGDLMTSCDCEFMVEVVVERLIDGLVAPTPIQCLITIRHWSASKIVALRWSAIALDDDSNFCQPICTGQNRVIPMFKHRCRNVFDKSQ